MKEEVIGKIKDTGERLVGIGTWPWEIPPHERIWHVTASEMNQQEKFRKMKENIKIWLDAITIMRKFDLSWETIEKLTIIPEGVQNLKSIERFVDKTLKTNRQKKQKEAKMKDQKAINALKKSIEKWEGVVEGTIVDSGMGNCELCHVFYRGDFRRCGNCPVKEDTKVDGCANTPYLKWADHQSLEHRSLPKTIHCPKCRELAQAELDYLKGLLKKLETPELKYKELDITLLKGRFKTWLNDRIRNAYEMGYLLSPIYMTEKQAGEIKKERPYWDEIKLTKYISAFGEHEIIIKPKLKCDEDGPCDKFKKTWTYTSYIYQYCPECGTKVRDYAWKD